MAHWDGSYLNTKPGMTNDTQERFTFLTAVVEAWGDVVNEAMNKLEHSLLLLYAE